MRRRLTYARQLTYAGFGLFLFLVPFRGDRNEVTSELIRLAPHLNPRLAHHLVWDDDAEFRAYASEAGLSEIKDGFMILDFGLATDSRESYRRTSRVLLPYMKRVGDALGAVYGFTEFVNEIDFRIAVGDSGRELKMLRYGLDSLQNDAGMSLDEKLRRYAEYERQCERFGYERLIAAMDGSRARDVMQIGDLAARGRYLRTALARAKKLEERIMICQFLGELGDIHRVEGDRDSMLQCYLEGIAIADRHRIPEQAARLRSFLASAYIDEGRLSLAADLLRDAQTACRRFGGGPYEVRTVFRSMKLFADLACWDIVGSQSKRLPVLLRALRRAGHYTGRERYVLDAELWNARLLARNGAPARAAEVMTSLLGRMRSTHGREGLPLIHRERAQALLEAGELEAAAKAVAEGLAYADSFHTPEDAVDLAITRVRVALAAGDVDLAVPALADARRRAAEVGTAASASNAVLTACTLDALEARIALARGHRDVAMRAVDRGMRRLRHRLAELDGSPPSYLFPGKVDELRRVAHEALESDGPASLGLELSWRSLPSVLGREPLPAAIPAVQPSDPDDGTLRIVFTRTDTGIVRWTRIGADVRREVLACSASECERLVYRFMHLVSTDPIRPESPPPAELQKLAKRLGTCLLPPELRGGPRHRVLVSADGPLARVPFEALDAGGGTAYVPLLAIHDVAYARPVAPRPRGRGSASSLFLIGARDEGMGPSGAGSTDLNAVESEIAAAKQCLPAGPLLRSTAASKRDVLDAMRRASVVYIAAHQARDAQVPLFAYFPMSFGARPASLEDRYLDLSDLRGVDFSGCDLAVLSSCASGEPYVVDGRSGPSMADVILDAGANTAIHTRWRVRDDQAATIAPRLAGNWVRARSRDDAIAIWAAERRVAIRGARGVRHPFGWAAWSVTVSEPCPPWPGWHNAVIASAGGRASVARAARAESRGLARSLRGDMAVRP